MPSMVWTCFQKTEAGPKCLLCNDLRKRRDSSTKTMWVHLKLKHQEIYHRLRGADISPKSPLKTAESTSKQTETNLMTQYNQLLMSNYMMLPFGQLQSATNLAFCQQNGAFFQNVAFNKFVFDLYARLFANNCSPVSTSPTELKPEHNLSWLTNEPMQACQNFNFDMNMDYKAFGKLSNS